MARPVFHAVENALRPHEFRGKNQQAEGNDDEAWSGKNEHRRAYRDDGETNHRGDGGLHIPNHLYLILVSGDNQSKEKPVPLLRHLAAAAILLTVTAVPARADGLIVPFIGFSFGGDSSATCATVTNCKEKRTNYGVSLISMGAAFGIEEDISYAKNFFGETPGAENSVFSAMTNVIIGPGVGPIRPYVAGGVGLIRPHVSSFASSITSFDLDKNAFGWDWGGGLTGMFGSHIGIRGDLRHFHTFQDLNLLIFNGQKLDFWRASVGLALGF